MVALTAGMDGIRSAAQLLTVFLIFILVLFLTYWTTRFAGNFQKQQMAGKNIRVMETVSVSNGKFLQIVKIGNRYFVIGVSKDNITYLCELKEEDLDFSSSQSTGDSFKNILEKFRKNGQVLNNEENNH